MPGGKKRRTVGVCTECRQSKVKCDSETTYPQPCTRCQVRGLECAIDPTFHRTPARQQLNNMTAELHRLRREKALGSVTNESADRAQASRGPPPSPQPPSHDIPFGINMASVSLFGDSPLVLGICTFSAQDVCRRFLSFTKHFHHYMPIVDLDTPATALYLRSPFLFWTIITISCRLFPLHDVEQEQYHEAFLSLLQTTSLTSPLTLHSIQALLLLCTWPLPIRSQLSDPSWIYCSIASGAAGYLNLNRVAGERRYHGGQLATTDMNNMSRTWLATFNISMALSTWVGIPITSSHSKDLVGIESHIYQESTPVNLAAEAAILLVYAKHLSVLTPNIDFEAHEALTDMHIAELDKVSKQFPRTPHKHFTVLATKLNLLTRLIMSWTKHSGISYQTTRDQTTALAHRLLIGSSQAWQIISNFNAITQPSDSDGETISSSQKFFSLPKTYCRILLFATCFLIRFSCTNPLFREADRNRSCDAVETAAALLARSSACSGGPGKGDEPARASLVIELLLRHQKEGRINDFQIDDRGNGSLLWDSLYKAYILRGRSTEKADLHSFIDPVNASATTNGAREGAHDKTPEADEISFVSFVNDIFDITQFEQHGQFSFTADIT